MKKSLKNTALKYNVNFSNDVNSFIVYNLHFVLFGIAFEWSNASKYINNGRDKIGNDDFELNNKWFDVAFVRWCSIREKENMPGNKIWVWY